MNDTLLRILIVLLLVGAVMTGCSRSPAPKPVTSRAPEDLKTLLDDNRGRVLILLMGRDGCPGTAKATEALDEYASVKPERVSIMRLDVPLPDETLKLTSEWKYSFPRFVDTGRKIAGQLDFFYYPTLYVFDGDGEKRYVGACDNRKVAGMAREILSEKPGTKKKIYTLPIPAVGESAPAFSGDTLAGKTASQSSLMNKHGLLMVFARTSCRFCAEEMPRFKEISDTIRGKGVGVVIVNQQEELDTIKPVYQEKCAGVPVIWDKNGDICRSYGVDAVPFFFLLDGDGKIVSRRSFTHTAAVNSVNGMLGMKTEKSRFKPTEGG